MCKVEMFGAWLRVDTSATYRKLARALTAVGKRNIGEALCTAKGMEVTALEVALLPLYSSKSLHGNEVTFEGVCTLCYGGGRIYIMAIERFHVTSLYL